MPDDARFLPSTGERKITNIVLMGMGEPLYNFDNVKRAIEVAADGEGLSVSKRRITLSTSGIVPEIGRWGEEAGTMLAISLHATHDELRDELVPINRKWPIASLLRRLPQLPRPVERAAHHVRVRDAEGDQRQPRGRARACAARLPAYPPKINLIPFNPWPGAPYECSDWEQIERFAEVVNKAGYASPVRTPRGRDIMPPAASSRARACA